MPEKVKWSFVSCRPTIAAKAHNYSIRLFSIELCGRYDGVLSFVSIGIWTNDIKSVLTDFCKTPRTVEEIERLNGQEFKYNFLFEKEKK
ncbi:MAG: hypothetical protein KKC53_04070 [Actinobacteria bacterium]|nr:hypothetical protein [Actinomycetota bacterium]